MWCWWCCCWWCCWAIPYSYHYHYHYHFQLLYCCYDYSTLRHSTASRSTRASTRTTSVASVCSFGTLEAFRASRPRRLTYCISSSQPLGSGRRETAAARFTARCADCRSKAVLSTCKRISNHHGLNLSFAYTYDSLTPLSGSSDEWREHNLTRHDGSRTVVLYILTYTSLSNKYHLSAFSRVRRIERYNSRASGLQSLLYGTVERVVVNTAHRSYPREQCGSVCTRHSHKHQKHVGWVQRSFWRLQPTCLPFSDVTFSD